MVRNAATRVPVVGATVRLRAAADCTLGAPAGPALATETTNSLGKYFFLDLGGGAYCVDVMAAGLLSMRSDDFVFGADEIRLVSFGMQPGSNPGQSPNYTTVCGRVADTSMNLVEGATVNLIAETPTGTGIVQSDESSAFGNFCIVGAPMHDEIGPFSNWSMSALRAGHLLSFVPPGMVPATSRVTIFVDWSLIPLPATPVCFLDGFETDAGWTTDLSWNGIGWQRRVNAPLVNANVPMCVSLPAENESCMPDPMDPEDECALCITPGAPACIPVPGALTNAFAGTFVQWFGDPSSGSFLGSGGICGVDDGGISSVPYDASLVSPPVDLTLATDATLRFAGWWEIESVDPASNQFDVMTVYASDDPIAFETTPGCGGTLDCGTCPLCVGILNPPFDRSGAEEEPFSSGGFLAAPVWHLYEFDLAPWAGGTVYLRFRFETVDENYNGFRGLAIDDVVILGSGC